METGSIPQWITAFVALSAAAIAAIGITIQSRLAKRRAAIDFFLKTEADKYLVESYDAFWVGVQYMKTMPVEEFCDPQTDQVKRHYFAVRRYLNVHELIAVGIKNRLFDDRTCYDFWSRILIRCVEAAKPVLDHMATRPGHEATYLELQSLYLNWVALERQLSRRSMRQPLV